MSSEQPASFPAPIPGSVERTRGVALAAVAGAGQRVVQLVGTVLSLPLVLEALGNERFGIWGGVVSLAWLVAFTDLGVGHAVLALVANARARGSGPEAREHVAGALLAGAGTAAALAVGGGAVVLLFASPREAPLYLCAVAGLALNVPLSFANFLWQALQRGWVAGIWELVQTVLSIGALLVAALGRESLLGCVVAMFGGLVLANSGSLVHLFLRHPEVRPFGMPSMARLRGVVAQGIPFFALGVAANATFLFDNVLALELLGPAESARVTVVMRLGLTALGLLYVVTFPLWPAFTDAAVQGNRAWLRSAFLRGTSLVTACAIAGAAALLLGGGPVLRVWLGTDLGVDDEMLWALAAWLLALALLRVPTLLFNALSVVWFQVLVYGVATLASIALKIVLLPRLGAPALLWGTTLALVVFAMPAFAWRGREILDSR